MKIKKDRRIFRNWAGFIFRIIGTILLSSGFTFAIWFLTAEYRESVVYTTLKIVPFVVLLLLQWHTDWKTWHVYPASIVVAEKYVCIFTPLQRHCWRWSEIERIDERVSPKGIRRSLDLYVKGRGLVYSLRNVHMERGYLQVVQEMRERYGSATIGE